VQHINIEIPHQQFLYLETGIQFLQLFLFSDEIAAFFGRISNEDLQKESERHKHQT